MTWISLVLSIVAVGVALLAIRRADVVERRVRSRLPSAEASGGSGGANSSVGEETRTAGDSGAAGVGSGDTAAILARLQALESRQGRAGQGLTRVAVVRYDAFEEVGGELSYSVALVDDAGVGLVLTAIHGRSETRTYVKQVPQDPDAARTIELSPEEREAVRTAMGSRTGRR